MAINRRELLGRHNPILDSIEYKSPLSVGNGNLVFTVDVTGLQTFYDEYNYNLTPLSTMSQWGWHTTPVSKSRYAYTMDDLEMTEYNYSGRKVTYAVDKKQGNEDVYNWLRRNPHKFNLGRLGFLYRRKAIKPKDIYDIKQTLNLYEGTIESSFKLHGALCKVKTLCHNEQDTIAVEVESELLTDGLLSIELLFPYGSPEISGSDWNNVQGHNSRVINNDDNNVFIERSMDRTKYYTCLRFDNKAILYQNSKHDFRMESIENNRMSFSATFFYNMKDDPETCPCSRHEIPSVEQTYKSSLNGWRTFWETGGIVKLYNSADKRAFELERRILLSQYQLRINCCGLMPPQETGLLCNSWHGKFHLEMYLWHQAYLPLWNQTELMMPSIDWYTKILPRAKDNAKRNGFRGAKWPKQVAYDGIDSPSPIATLLIWQQPHIIYMLEIAYQSEHRKENNDLNINNSQGKYKPDKPSDKILEQYWLLIKETADYMVDLLVFNEASGAYDLVPPLIPAQEAHEPTRTLNPVFEVEYWRFALLLAISWAKRLDMFDEENEWLQIAGKIAKPPIKDGLYIAHENCTDTYEKYNVDHPMMTAIYGLICSDRVDKDIMKKTLYKIESCWDFDSTWGWDYAMMAMTATRLGLPGLAIELLLMDTPNNYHAINGHNRQSKREELPVYLPGNGSLLLAIAMMTAGFSGSDKQLPGFPKNGDWSVEYENITPFPY